MSVSSTTSATSTSTSTVATITALFVVGSFYFWDPVTEFLKDCGSVFLRRERSDRRYFSVLVEPSLHGLLIAKFDVCNLAITSTDRGREVHSRDLRRERA